MTAARGTTAGGTAAGATAVRHVTRSKLKLALAIAARELRSGAGGLTVFVLCIALGVAAVAAIGSLAASFDEALARQGRTLIGGDLSFELIHRQANEEELAALKALGQLSESASFRAMARSQDGKSALIEVKAVDGAYPLYGDVAITRAGKTGPIWRDGDVVLVERTLLDRLNLDVGSTLLIGEATTTIGGVLGEQPDRLADRLAYGPKLLMSRATLAKTGLVQPGSLIRWTYRVKLPEPAASDKDALTEARKDIEKRFPESGFAIHDWTDPAPSLRRDADRFTQFINFVGLTALLLGGIGVGNAIRSYMAKKREIIAIFKCLGASSRLVLGVYLLQALFLASLGIALGLVVGALAPAAIATIYGNTIPIDLAIEPHPLPLLTAALAGLLTMVLFVLWPLGRAALVSPAVLMRAHLSDERERSSLPFALGSVAAGIALFALAIAASEERHHHRLDLGRDRRRLRALDRLRHSRAAARRQGPAHQIRRACARARQHRRTGLARPLDRRLARARPRPPGGDRSHPPLAGEGDRQQYRGRCPGLLLPRRRGRRPQHLP